METIYIRKQYPSGPEGAASFVVPAVGIKTQQGLRLIPHPYGTQSTAFDALDEAIRQIHRAGYIADFEGKAHHPANNHTEPPKRLTTTKPGDSVERIIRDAAPLLIAQLGDSMPGVIANAAFALGELREESAMPGLIHAFSNDDATVRRNAAEAMAKIGKPAINALKLALQDKHWLVRHSALTAIVELIHQRYEPLTDILPEVLIHLKDESWLVRSQSSVVFAELAKQRAQQEDDAR